jgi:hypothetical protein
MFDSSNQPMRRGKAVLYQGGEVVAGCTILRRAADASSYLRWLVRLPCGCETIKEGNYLRKLEKKGGVPNCELHGSLRKRVVDGG